MQKMFPLPNASNSEAIMVNGIYKIFKPIIYNLDQLDRTDTLEDLLVEIKRMKNKGISITRIEMRDQSNSERKEIGTFLKEKFRKNR